MADSPYDSEEPGQPRANSGGGERVPVTIHNEVRAHTEPASRPAGEPPGDEDSSKEILTRPVAEKPEGTSGENEGTNNSGGAKTGDAPAEETDEPGEDEPEEENNDEAADDSEKLVLSDAPQSPYDEPNPAAPTAPLGSSLKDREEDPSKSAKEPVDDDKKADSRDELANKEAGGGEPGKAEKDGGSSFYTDADEKLLGAGRFSFIRRFNRRRALFGGGMLGTIIAIIIFLTLGSGPLQFVHIAKLLEQFHLSHQENAGDDRMGKIYRFARAGGRPGETRLGWLGSKMHANILADLEKIGLKPTYGALDTYQGFEIDRSSPGSPFKDMSNQETLDTLKARGVNVKEVTFDGAKASVTVKGYINQRKSLGFLVNETGNSKVAGSIRVRVLSRYGLVTWHPMKVLDKALNAKLADLYDKWRQAREERLAKGTEIDTLNTTGGQDEESDGKGGTTKTALADEKIPLSSDKIKGIISSISESRTLKITGGIAAAAGIVCMVKTVNDNFGEIKYVQIIAPLTRMGMDAVVVGNQIMTGQDVDSTTVSFLAKSFNELDGAGNTVSNWSDAQSIHTELGDAGGVPVDSTANSAHDLVAKGVPGFISWVTGVPAINQICSTAGSIITGIVSVGIGVLSGGTASTAGGILASSLAGPYLIDKLSHLLAGKAVNVLATGAEWGNDINYGARLGGNAMALGFGGVALSDSQTAVLDNEENAQVRQEFNSQSLAHRLFSPTDPYSAIAKVIDNSSPSLNGNLHNIGSIFTRFGGMFAAIPKLFTTQAKAAAVGPYDYGFPEYGFSQADLDNSAVADPFDNADKAAVILDSANGQAYIDKAMDCFGVSITKGDDGWDVIPGDGSKGPFNPTTNPYSDKYSSGDCVSPSGLDPAAWLRIRFFVFDTGIMEGYACYQGDDTSCSNDGFGGGVTNDTGSATTTTSGGPLPTGSAQDLATQLMQYVNNGKIKCTSGCADIANTAKGVSIKTGSWCQVDSLNPSLLGMLLKLAQMNHTFTLSALCSDHPTIDGLSGHNGGRAADFNTIDGTFMGPDDVAWTPAKIAVATKLDQDIASFMPKSTGFGQIQCHPTFGFLSGFDTFNDTCHHQHVQVEI